MILRTVALLVALGIAVVAVGCGSNGDEATPTGVAGTSTATGTPGSFATPSARSELSLRGEEVERVADSAVQKVTWPDGTVYEEPIYTLMLRTLGKPDAPQGRRVVARWLADDRWQVTIFLRMEDRSTDPKTVIDLRADFSYEEGTGVFEPVNGRAVFAFTGRDPCASDEPPADLCPLDKEIELQ
jgi:hypothetical protein